MIPRKRNADDHEASWIAEEDAFVLQQAYRKAQIRVKEGRPKPVDRLAVTIWMIDETRNPLDAEINDSELEVADAQLLLDSLDHNNLEALYKDLSIFTSLEVRDQNKDFWRAVCAIVEKRRQDLHGTDRAPRGAKSISGDVGKLFQSKSYDELLDLEKQIKTKLASNGPVDTEYWQSILTAITSWKAKAQIKAVSRKAIDLQLRTLRQEQAQTAHDFRRKLPTFDAQDNGKSSLQGTRMRTKNEDPESLLRLPQYSRQLVRVGELDWLRGITTDRNLVLQKGYIPTRRNITPFQPSIDTTLAQDTTVSYSNPPTTAIETDYDVARSVGELEEIVDNKSGVTDSGLKKPSYWGRELMGYEWNKYNQTHFDSDNPPPKVVQGYEFHIQYPDLISKSRAPTFKIVRDHGRRRGQMSAPAGEEDRCKIVFKAGYPYQDLAFKIVDREWDYSARRERGFESTFENGELRLCFHFRRMFYRK